MTIRLRCPNQACGRFLNVKEEYAGKRGKCPGCGTAFLVPMAFASAGPPEVRSSRPTPLTTPAPVVEIDEPEPEEEPMPEPSAEAPAPQGGGLLAALDAKVRFHGFGGHARTVLGGGMAALILLAVATLLPRATVQAMGASHSSLLVNFTSGVFLLVLTLAAVGFVGTAFALDRKLFEVSICTAAGWGVAAFVWLLALMLNDRSNMRGAAQLVGSLADVGTGAGMYVGMLAAAAVAGTFGYLALGLLRGQALGETPQETAVGSRARDSRRSARAAVDTEHAGPSRRKLLLVAVGITSGVVVLAAGLGVYLFMPETNPNVTQANWDKVQTGMTREQVEAIMGPGKPTSAQELQNTFPRHKGPGPAGGIDAEHAPTALASLYHVDSWYRWRNKDDTVFAGFSGTDVGSAKLAVAGFISTQGSGYSAQWKAGLPSVSMAAAGNGLNLGGMKIEFPKNLMPPTALPEAKPPAEAPPTDTPPATRQEVPTRPAPTPPVRIIPTPPPAPPRPPRNPDPYAQALEDMQAVDMWTRRNAADRLTRMNPNTPQRGDVSRALEQLLTDSSQPVREAAARALVTWATPDSVPALIMLVNDESRALRASAMDALARLKDERAADAVAGRLADAGDRGRAIKTLKAIGPPAEPAVRRLLQDRDSTVRIEACHLLKVIGTRSSIRALQSALRDRDRSVALAARDALLTIAQHR
jgi:hypothetical protein